MTKAGMPVADGAVIPFSRNAGFSVILPIGEYVVTAASRAAGQLGAYTLTSAVVPESVTGCAEIFVTAGVTTHQSLGRGDCQVGYPEQLGDHFRIYVRKGTTITLIMSASEVDTRLELYDTGGALLADAEENVSYSSLDSRLVFTPGTSGYYVIFATTAYGFGDYTLTIE